MSKVSIQICDDLRVEKQGHIGLVEIQRPPYNFFDIDLIQNLGLAFKALEGEGCRAIVLASEGKAFCAGANFSNDKGDSGGVLGEKGTVNPLYAAGIELFACQVPIVAAIQGAAIGGGLGLALVADFRVVSQEARFSANFVRLGIHPGFGLTHTLPALIGQQNAALMFYTGRRINGDQALSWGLADELVASDQLREKAFALAEEMAEGAPLALKSIKATLKQGLLETLKRQTSHENDEQAWQKNTEDFKEGVRSVSEKRVGHFKGQ